MKNVLFACSHNAGRSQMAAAFFNATADPSRAHAVSAGTEPADRIHPNVVKAMAEIGIDLAGSVPTRLSARLTAEAHYLVTMGCGDACPLIPPGRREDWPLADPAEGSLDLVREVRDEVRRRVIELVTRKGWGS